MNPLLWLAGVLLFISAVCFIADWLIKYFGEGWDTSSGVDAEPSIGEPSSPELSFSEALKFVGPMPSWEETRRE